MPIQIFQTTAENIIASVDAVLTKPSGCDLTYVAQFMDVPSINAENALKMANELGLVRIDPTTGDYFPQEPFAIYLVSGKDSQKAAVLRVVLEKYEPYKAFKTRLEITGIASTAAEQVKLIFGLTPHREEIKDTLISIGTFAQSLVSEGAGLFRPKEYST